MGYERRLLGRVKEALEPLGIRLTLQARGGGAHHVDTFLAIRVGDRQFRYAAEIKRAVRPATLGPVIHQLREGPDKRLLVTDHVTPPVADRLRAEGVEFIDAAGNAYLNRPPLLVFVKGQRPAGNEPTPDAGRAFQATGLQVLFALLARPGLVAQPYRKIAAEAGVAHGTVGWVMAEMPGLGYVAHVGGRRRLINAERLLDQWTQAYARTLRPKLLLGRFRGDIETLAARPPAALLIGGETAAARITRYLRPATATFYTHAIEPATILALRLHADPRGNVDFRRRFWNFDPENPALTPELLVYADLLAIGDTRCLETAQLLRGPILDRLV